jgi:magnesium chelatase subunit D
LTIAAAHDADWTAPLLALMGPQLGGVVLSEAAEDTWLAAYSALGPQAMDLRAVPSSVTADQLTGALDLAATLATGSAVMQTGLLQDEAAALLIRRAAKLESVSVALIGHALDSAQLTLVLTDDSYDDEPAVSAILNERLAFSVRDGVTRICSSGDIAKAKKHLPHVSISDAFIETICASCIAFGITSPRVSVFAVAVAKGLAALNGRLHVAEDDVACAAALVLGHRATQIPQTPEQQPDAAPPPDEKSASDAAGTAQQPADAEVVVAAVKASLPPHVLQNLMQGVGRKAASRSRGEKQKKALASQRGRVTGTMPARNIARQRLNILATLRAAAPWQVLRRKDKVDRLIVLRDDLRASRRKQRTEATAIFAVDASGSTAFQRLAEAKGAVETLLSECYVRRDRVAVISFRSKTAEVLLPPTRSVERARRALTALAGGGGTPMASALDQLLAIAGQVKRSGGKPVVVLLTDGRANVTRGGEGDKVKAMAEAEEAAKRFAVEGHETLVMDVSPEPQKAARNLAQLLAGQYFHLPRAGASELAAPVRSVLQQAAR